MVLISSAHRVINRLIHRFSTRQRPDLDILWALNWVALFVSLVLVFWCWKIASETWELREQIRNQPSNRSLSARLTEVEAEHHELRDKVTAVEKAAKRAYGRQAQEKRRNGNANGLPDPKTDPDAWVREMNKRHALGERS